MKKKELVTTIPTIDFESVERPIYQAISALEITRKQYEKDTRDKMQEAIDELVLASRHLSKAREVIERLTSPF